MFRCIRESLLNVVFLSLYGGRVYWRLNVKFICKESLLEVELLSYLEGEFIEGCIVKLYGGRVD